MSIQKIRMLVKLFSTHCRNRFRKFDYLSPPSLTKIKVLKRWRQGAKLEQRLAERNRELQKDVEDRQREKEEIEELRAQIVREGYKDPNAELERRLAMQERFNNPALFFQHQQQQLLLQQQQQQQQQQQKHVYEEVIIDDEPQVEVQVSIL